MTKPRTVPISERARRSAQVRLEERSRTATVSDTDERLAAEERERQERITISRRYQRSTIVHGD